MKKTKEKIINNRGFTYVELAVVLSIFVTMTSIVIYNYGGFQAQVDIKNLGSDVALQIVQAQKDSLDGQFPSLAQQTLITSTWKPSYGVYFNIGSGGDNKSFVYFADLDNNSLYSNINCVGTGECMSKINITKGDYISSINVYYQNGSSAPLNDLTVTFKRPSENAIIISSQITPPLASPISYVQIKLASPSGPSANIEVYASGRIQIN